VISYFASKNSPQQVLPGVRFGRTAAAHSALEPHKPAALAIVRRLLALTAFQNVLVFAFFTTVLRSFFMFWIPKFMVDMGMGEVGAALTSAVFPFVGCLGTIALGWYTDRHAVAGDRAAAMWKMLLGLVLAMIAIALLIPLPSEHHAAIVVLLGLAGLFLYGPYSMSAGCLTLDIAGAEAAGTGAGLVDGFGYLGGALAAWGAGRISDQWGWAQVFWSLAALSLVTVAWAYYMSYYNRKGLTL
jgi:sugar phosphate permease